MVVKKPSLRQQRRRLEKKQAERDRLENLANAKYSMKYVMERWLTPEGEQDLSHEMADGTRMLHIGMGHQNREDAVHAFKEAVLEFSSMHAESHGVHAEGGSEIEQGMPHWNYVHYAEMTKWQGSGGGGEQKRLYLLLEYIPWAEEASVFVSMLDGHQLALFAERQRARLQEQGGEERDA